MKVLITGITGFAGSHLAEFVLSQKGTQVFGLCRDSSRLDNLAKIKDRLQLVRCDLFDPSGTAECFKKIKPDRIFHLAGQSNAAGSWESAAPTLKSNILGGLHVLEAVRRASPKAGLLIAGSAEEYGACSSDRTPVSEKAPTQPLSPYGVSKAALSFLAYEYFRNYKIHAVRARSFNHTGPRQKDAFAAGSFAKQIAQIEAGLKPPILDVGNLEAERDFTDVRDVVRAYWLLLQAGTPGEVYNVCSGRGVKIQRLLDIYFEKSKVKVRIQKDPGRLRPDEVSRRVGDPSKLKKTTGWQPSIPLETTLEDLLGTWRERIGPCRT